ncbi:MAG: family transposase [Verrucomicrobiales bacterium]|nr:family transposase [Verrucomicrobiales bacterium]
MNELINQHTRARLGDGREMTVRGLLMHSSMALTLDSVPLGLAAVQFRSHQRFKDANAFRLKANSARIPIEEKESHRWLENLGEPGRLLGNPERQVHIGDRKSDIYELFCMAQSGHAHFLVRTCADCLTEAEGHTMAKAMEKSDGSGSHTLFFDAGDGRVEEAWLDVRWRRLRILPPVGKRVRWPELELSVIHATERGAPAGREPIDWKLLTSLPVSSLG